VRGRTAALAATVAGVAVGAGWGLGRVAARRLRAGRAPAALEGPGAARAVLDPPADRTHAVTTSDGAVLHVIERGSGRPVVLVHGYTLRVAVWTLQLERWPDRGRRVVAYDQRGHGASTVGADGLTPAALAADLRAVLEHLDLRDAVVVGHSLGGMVLQQLALDHPDVVAQRVRRLVLLSTAARGTPWAGSRLLGLVERTGGPYGRVTPGVMARRELGFFLAAIGVGPRAPAWIVERSQDLTSSCPPGTIAAAGRLLLRFDVSDQVAAITSPTTVVCGRADRLTPLRESMRLAERIPGARLEIVPGAGHMLMLEAPDELEEVVLGRAGGASAREVVAGVAGALVGS
jgi:pimeloyl-ACP methyl ester carboxylesterase